jgi:2-succinyl-6-hydroxy-2,4-cyclohexadiene-1-carboxylate synthase
VLARLLSLTLVAGTAGLDDDEAQTRRRTVDDERAAALANDPDTFLDAFWRLPLFDSLASHPEKAARLAERQARARAHPSVLAWWMRGLSVGRQPSSWSSLSSLTVPVAVVVGALDADYVIHARRLHGLLPSARLTIVPGVGHALLLEAPSAVATAIAAIAAIADQRATS